VRTAVENLVLAAPLVSLGRAGATWRRSHNVRRDRTTEPPAHYRLVSGHDLFEIVAFSDCTASHHRSSGGPRWREHTPSRSLFLRSFPLVRQRDIPSGADALGRARPAELVKAGDRPPAKRVALTGAERGARELWTEQLVGLAWHLDTFYVQ
jgi:hypothetical protein